MEAKTIRTKNTEYVKISWRDEAEYKRWIGMLQRVCENWKEENAEIAKLLDIFISRAKEDGSTGEYAVCFYIRRIWWKSLNSSSFSPESAISRKR